MGELIVFLDGPVPAYALNAVYNPGLVALSYIVASIAAFTALDFAGRMVESRGDRTATYSWLLGGACAMGAGIWCMHFVAMLAYRLPLTVQYNLPTTLLSMLFAIVISGFAILVVSHRNMTRPRLLVGGIIMGLGICTMHYTGMIAMRMDAMILYRREWFLLSIVNAIVCSTIALWLVSYLGRATQRVRTRYNVMAALMMGVAICGMHYTAMYATVCVSTGVHTQPVAAIDPTLLGTMIGSVTIAIMGAALAVSLWSISRRLERQNLLLAEEIAERKRIERELVVAKESAEAANRAKSTFLSSMSHDLRSPLNAILGFGQLMKSDKPVPTPSQQANIDRILQAGWYLLELINEILDLALIESGKLSIALEPVSMHNIMLECQSLIEPQAKQHGIRVSFPRFDHACVVNGDRTRVKQILINLLSNAIKYNQAGGSVVVEGTVSPPDKIRISIRDTGAGLPPDKLAQLFQPFNRLGQEAGAEEGTGIGLVVTKRLVELMGGAIGVESTVGVGSVFWVELNSASAPSIAEGASEPAASAKTQLESGGPLRTLLYVEDNPANLELVKQLIARRPDMRLLTAVNGNLGIELARAAQPDMILMDINLPGMSGTEAMKILRADTTTAHIPVLALSANAIPSDIERGLEAGFFRYLTKPIRVNEFMEALDVALKFAENGASQGKSDS